MLDEPRVTAIGLHLEGLKNVPGFARAAHKALEKGIPIIALKTGVSQIGAELALSHTSSLSGSDALYDSLRDGLVYLALPLKRAGARDAGKGIPFVNAAGYRNAEVDALLAQAAVEPDEAKRVAQFRQFQKIVMHDLPLLPLVAVPRGNVWNQRVQGLLQGVEGSAGSFGEAWLAPAAR